MKRSLRWWGWLAVLGTVVLLPGCTIRGGAWLVSIFTGGKATFTLNGTYDPYADTVSGQSDYQDKRARVSAHLVSGPCDLDEEEFYDFLYLVDECLYYTGVEPTEENSTFLFGQYTPQPKTRGPGGCFQVFVVDQGPGNAGQGDFVVLKFYGGIYDGYYNCGVIQGGNLKVTN